MDRGDTEGNGRQRFIGWSRRRRRMLAMTQPTMVGYNFMVPTVLLYRGFRVVIFLHDHTPRHVHVYRTSDEVVVIDLEPTVSVRENKGMKSKDVRTALQLVNEYRDFLLSEWDRLGPIP